MLKKTLIISREYSRNFWIHTMLTFNPSSGFLIRPPRQQMALKAVHVKEVPNLDHLNHSNPAFNVFPHLGQLSGDGGAVFPTKPADKFMVIGHRGSGMNLLQSPDSKMKSIKENSILAFNAAGKFHLDYIEFDVQVTKDDHPIIFHDSFIFTKEKGVLIEKRVTDLTLDEFLSYGPQREPDKVGKPLFRKTKDGRIFKWKVEKDDHLCTLEEVFQKVNHSLGFNIEFKFDDNINYKEDELVHAIQVVLRVVSKYAKDRSIIYSSFQPDAALLIKKLQTTYPVFFLTNGGSEIFTDIRRNSLEEAMKLCLSGSLNGIVSEVRAILRNPAIIRRIKESKLSLISYGQLNNTREVVYAQLLMGVDGVIVDFIHEITEAVSEFNKNNMVESEGESSSIKCWQNQLSNLMNLTPGLVQP